MVLAWTAIGLVVVYILNLVITITCPCCDGKGRYPEINAIYGDFIDYIWEECPCKQQFLGTLQMKLYSLRRKYVA